MPNMLFEAMFWLKITRKRRKKKFRRLRIYGSVNNIATSLSGIYEISRKLYTTILFIKIDFIPAGHHQLDLIQIDSI